MTEPNPGAATPESDRVVIKITAQTLRQWLQIARRSLGWLTLAYVGGLFVIVIALEWGGEKLWLLSLLLFAPPQVMLLPLLILTPLCMVFRPRLCLWHLGIVLILAFGYMNFRWSGTPVRTERTLTAVTFNAGQSSHSQFTQFIEHEKPDVVLMQDAGTTLANSLQKKLPGYHVARYGEYSLLSRFPIQKAALLPAPLGEGRPVGARFEVLVHAQPVAFYGVHMPTPRRVLSHFMGGRRILGEIAGVSRRDPLYGSYGEWLDQRIQLARDLRQVFADEKLPFIVGGDFNMADHGHIYHLFAGEMTDAFKASGRGWGMTFPGSTRNPVAGFGPWLRLDYFFAGRGWRAVECRPEPGRKSQHKAVLARFEPLPPK
jgi:endonuclease/exonuclease/phosphatase (EEP) superfamily protein YafD